MAEAASFPIDSEEKLVETKPVQLPELGEQRLVETEIVPSPKPELKYKKKQIMYVAILCFINLINYMDRMTVAGILPKIRAGFDLDMSEGGIIQTSFIVMYMIAAPVFGYLGDRFNRCRLMAFGVFIWTLTTLVGSFMPNFHTFILMRCLVGVGEASYSTIAPTLIADMFVKDQRSKMLAFFYFAIPVGSGLGYIIGSETVNIAERFHGSDESWRWGLRVTPVLGVVAVLMILFLMEEPNRGEMEGGEHIQTTSYLSDMKYLICNRSFVLSTLSFTCVCYVTGALSWWGPSYVQMGVMTQVEHTVVCASVPLVFGAVAMMAGICGVPLGSFSGQMLRRKFAFGDPMVCGIGLAMAAPLLLSSLYFAASNTIAAYVLVFLGQLFLNLNWAVVSDILLYTVIPTRRSSAEAFQILFSHALGDASSPYIAGVVADHLKSYYSENSTDVTTTTPFPMIRSTPFPLANMTTTPATPSDNGCSPTTLAEFHAMQMSLYLTTAVLLLGAFFFLLNCFVIKSDKEKADKIIAENTDDKTEASVRYSSPAIAVISSKPAADQEQNGGLSNGRLSNDGLSNGCQLKMAEIAKLENGSANKS